MIYFMFAFLVFFFTVLNEEQREFLSSLVDPVEKFMAVSQLYFYFNLYIFRFSFTLLVCSNFVFHRGIDEF